MVMIMDLVRLRDQLESAKWWLISVVWLGDGHDEF